MLMLMLLLGCKVLVLCVVELLTVEECDGR